MKQNNITQESIEKEQTEVISDEINRCKQEIMSYQNKVYALEKRITTCKYLVKMQILTYTNIPSILVNKLYATKDYYDSFQVFMTERKNLK